MLSGSTSLLTRRVLLVSSLLPAVSSLPDRTAPIQQTPTPVRTSGLSSSTATQRFPTFSAASRACEASASRSESMTTATAPESVIVYVTVPDLDTGKKIGHALVSERLAACVNVIPGLTSIYTWEGAVQEDSELLLMIKTTSAAVEELTSKVQSMHPYDVCEVIAVPITGGSQPYLNWIKDTVRDIPSS